VSHTTALAELCSKGPPVSSTLQTDPPPSIVPALPPRRQQPNRFQFLIRLPEERNALLALIVLHVVGKAVDVGVPELLARHKVARTFENDSNLVWHFPFCFLLAAHVRSPFAGLYVNLAEWLYRQTLRWGELRCYFHPEPI
jgi:hypothetical protein